MTSIVASSFKPWVVWGIASFFYLYEMILRVSPSVMTQELMQEFQVSSTSLGVLISFYYFAYVPLQIPCGLIVDKFGTRRIITFSAILCMMGTYLFGCSSSLLIAEIGRFLVGAGSACAFIGCLKVTVSWFRPHQFALIAGLSNMMGTLGSTFAGRPLATLVNLYGWRATTLCLSAMGVIIIFLAWFGIQDSPSEKKSKLDQDSFHLWPTLKRIITNRQIWLAGTIGGLMYLPISAFSELWAVPFLMSCYNINSELASTANIMLFLGMALGGPLAAWLAKIQKNYVKVMKISTLITAFLFLAIAYAQIVSLTVIFFLLLASGITIGGQVLCFTCAKNNTPSEVSGTTIAFTNGIVMMSGVIFQPLLGWLLDLAWNGKLTNHGLRIYDHSCYQTAILAVPICLFLSWILLHWLKDSYKTEE